MNHISISSASAALLQAQDREEQAYPEAANISSLDIAEVLLHLSQNPGKLWPVTLELQKSQKAKVTKFWDSWIADLTLQGQ